MQVYVRRKAIPVIISLGIFLWFVFRYLYSNEDALIFHPYNIRTSVNRLTSYHNLNRTEKIYSSNLNHKEKIYSSNLTLDQVKLELSTEPHYDVSASCQHEVFLLVIVTSHPKNLERRRYIRSSWASSYTNDIRLKKSPKPF